MLPELSGVYQEQEKLLVGMYVDGHPLREIQREAQKNPFLHALASCDLSSTLTDQKVCMIGVVKEVRPIHTKTKSWMARVTLQDATGEYQAVVFPKQLLMYGSLVVLGYLLVLRGKIQHSPERKRAKEEEEGQESMTASVRFEMVVESAEGLVIE